MQSSRAAKGIILLLLAAVAVVIVLRYWKPPTQPPAPVTERSETRPKPQPSRRVESSPRPQAALSPETSPELDDPSPLKLPQEKLDAYLKLHHRDAASLLAVFHASDDINYLKEAATNFPNDPHVQWTVLARDAFPEDRRQWLDAFKASSPSNSIAYYLSAREYFKNNQPDAAIKELSEASGKSQFMDYAMESYLGEEDLFRSSGASPRIANTAAMAAMSADLLPELAGTKGIVNSVADLQKQYVNSGDTASSENLAQMSLGLANRFTRGDGGRFLISQLVGMAEEGLALQQLNQNTSYDFLGGQTPAQRLEELKQRKQVLRGLSQSISTTFLFATDDEMNAYCERMKIYGEIAAMQWWQQQHPAATPNTGN